MSNVAITGHTLGLGYELASMYPNHIGFSRSNGYDISAWGTIDRIVKHSADADIFFNNAHCSFFQVDLLYALYESWKDTDKIIVNISSVSPETSLHRPHKYAVEKLALDAASNQLNKNSQCRIVLVKPALFDTSRSATIPGPRIPVRYVAHQLKLWLNSNTDSDDIIAIY